MASRHTCVAFLPCLRVAFLLRVLLIPPPTPSPGENGTPNTPSRHSVAGTAAGDNLKHAVDDGKMMSLLQQYRQAQVAGTCVWLDLVQRKAR